MSGFQFSRLVVGTCLMGVGLLLGCQGEENGAGVSTPAPQVPLPAAAVPGDYPEASAGNGGASSSGSGDVSPSVSACFREFEDQLREAPKSERAGMISQVSITVSACSRDRLEREGYEVDEEAAAAITRSMQEMSATFTQRLIRIGMGG